MKSIAGWTDEELGGAWSALVRQKRDYLRLDGLLDDVLATSGRDQDAVRRTALTRPHPVVPRRPAGNVLAALPLTVQNATGDRHA